MKINENKMKFKKKTFKERQWKHLLASEFPSCCCFTHN